MKKRLLFITLLSNLAYLSSQQEVLHINGQKAKPLTQQERNKQIAQNQKEFKQIRKFWGAVACTALAVTGYSAIAAETKAEKEQASNIFVKTVLASGLLACILSGEI